MKNYLNKIITFLQHYFVILKNNLVFVLGEFTKLKMKLVHLITENSFLYFLYIFLVLYSVFRWREIGECTLSDKITFFIVIYLMGSSLEIYIISKMPITKKFLILLVGKKFAITYIPTSFKQVLKYLSLLVSLTVCELVTQQISHNWEVHQLEALRNAYDKLYGLDRVNWDPEIKTQFFKERSNLIRPNYGFMTYLAHKAHFE